MEKNLILEILWLDDLINGIVRVNTEKVEKML